MTATETASHRCEFPVQPPHGSFADPGPCECGKTCLARIAEQRAAEAGLAVVDPEDLRVLLGYTGGADPDDLPAIMRIADLVAGVKP